MPKRYLDADHNIRKVDANYRHKVEVGYRASSLLKNGQSSEPFIYLLFVATFVPVRTNFGLRFDNILLAKHTV